MTTTPLPPIAGSAAFRKQLGTSLQTALGRKWVVFPDGKPINTITKPTLILERTSLTRSPAAPAGLRRSTYTLVAISNQTIADTKEDYLDGLIDDVLKALDDLQLTWSACERATFNGTNPCYQITFTASNNRS